MDNAEWKPNMQEGAYPKTTKKSVADQFAAVKYRSETHRAVILGPGWISAG